MLSDCLSHLHGALALLPLSAPWPPPLEPPCFPLTFPSSHCAHRGLFPISCHSLAASSQPLGSFGSLCCSPVPPPHPSGTSLSTSLPKAAVSGISLCCEPPAGRAEGSPYFAESHLCSPFVPRTGSVHLCLMHAALGSPGRGSFLSRLGYRPGEAGGGGVAWQGDLQGPTSSACSCLDSSSAAAEGLRLRKAGRTHRRGPFCSGIFFSLGSL